MNKKRDRAKSVIRFDNYNHEWWAGICPNCNRIIGFDYGCDSNPGNRNVIAQNVGNYVTLKMLIKHLAMLIKFYTYKQIQTIPILKREVNSKCKFYI